MTLTMKNVFNLVLAVFLVFLAGGLTANDAEAGRLGGGRSFGMQRQSVAPRPTAPNRQIAPTQPSAPTGVPAAAPKRSWLGPIAGLAAGLGLGALFSHLGMGQGMGSILMFALLAMAAVFVFKRLFRHHASPASPANSPLQYAGYSSAQPTPSSQPQFAASATNASATAIPAGFDSDAFLRVAKLNFIRLQAANDARNFADLREFLAPEVFAEIKLQMEERPLTPQQTDVVTLNAELLEIATEGERHIASVHFSGMVREEANAPVIPFSEIWHLSKPIDGSKGWLVAGIQQTN